MANKKILILTTGGTIACEGTAEGLKPELDSKAIMSYISGIADNYDIELKDILNLDSSNIQPEEWIVMASEVYKAYSDFDGIVITHGTDTMAYTSSMLASCFRTFRFLLYLRVHSCP